MLKRFKEIYQHTLKWEGGAKLHNVKNDAGGWTKYGIAFNFNVMYFKDFADFSGMTYDTACEISYKYYCLPIQLELVNPEAQAMYFDMAFNMGTKTAIRCAQRALKLTDDGIIGNKTKAALKNLKKEDLYAERVKYYDAIVKNNPNQKKFYKGWINRSAYFLKTDI